ncbi:MAG: hypothetical protein WBA46_07065, partial [Thermomicrobiales bacterium]
MTTHTFTPDPDRYRNTIGAHPPVLTSAPGDTVITTTVDARGYDKDGNRPVSGPNPQTGPFFIEGAEPGDTLVVHIDSLRPN